MTAESGRRGQNEDGLASGDQRAATDFAAGAGCELDGRAAGDVLSPDVPDGAAGRPVGLGQHVEDEPAVGRELRVEDAGQLAMSTSDIGRRRLRRPAVRAGDAPSAAMVTHGARALSYHGTLRRARTVTRAPRRHRQVRAGVTRCDRIP